MSRLRVLGGVYASAIGATADYDSPALCLDAIDGLAFQVVVTNDTPAVATFADGDVTLLSDEIEITDHGMATGLKVALTTTGVLPTGLSATDYYVIVVDEDVIQLASSYNNAVAGSAEDITAASGGGVHTLTPATFDCDVAVEASIDGVNWQALDTPITLTQSDAVLFNLPDRFERYVRVACSSVQGQVGITVHVNAKG